MRNAIISDTDGSSEYNKVSLTPTNWAWLAQKKATGGQRGETPESLTWKIARLDKINLLLNGMIATPADVNGSQPPAETTKQPDHPDLTAVTEFLKALKAYQNVASDYEKAAKTAPEGTTPDKKNLEDAVKAVNLARDKLTDFFAGVDKENIEKLNNVALTAQSDLFAHDSDLLRKQVAANEKQILAYQDQLKALKPTAGALSLQDTFAIAAGIPPAAPDISSSTPLEADYWTSISVEVSSSYTAEQTSSSSNSFSVGGSASWGLWSVGGSAAHSDATSDAAKQMAKSKTKASFDCMRVDITRSWLRAELFFDDDLRVAAGNSISPGAVTLAGLMDPDSYTVSDAVAKLNRETELARYDLFPMYPTAFLLAANVVLEIEGETADIQSHFHTSTTSGSAHVGWGPFAVSSSFSHTDTQASSSCEATATGCKITIKSPQIIGWVSEIVPALPRLPKVVKK